MPRLRVCWARGDEFVVHGVPMLTGTGCPTYVGHISGGRRKFRNDGAHFRRAVAHSTVGWARRAQHGVTMPRLRVCRARGDEFVGHGVPMLSGTGCPTYKFECGRVCRATPPRRLGTLCPTFSAVVCVGHGVPNLLE